MTPGMTDKRLENIKSLLRLHGTSSLGQELIDALDDERAEVKRLREREKDLTAQLFAAGEEIEALRHDLTRHIEIASAEASRL